MSADRLHKERRAAPDECETLVRGSAYRAAAREKPRTPASVRRPPTSGARTTRRDRTSLDPRFNQRVYALARSHVPFGAGGIMFCLPFLRSCAPMERATQHELQLASRMSRLGTETAFEVLNKARALERQGKSIIPLEIGEA